MWILVTCGTCLYDKAGGSISGLADWCMNIDKPLQADLLK